MGFLPSSAALGSLDVLHYLLDAPGLLRQAHRQGGFGFHALELPADRAYSCAECEMLLAGKGIHVYWRQLHPDASWTIYIPAHLGRWAEYYLARCGMLTGNMSPAASAVYMRALLPESYRGSRIWDTWQPGHIGGYMGAVASILCPLFGNRDWLTRRVGFPGRRKEQR